jgi:hypothetical protein
VIGNQAHCDLRHKLPTEMDKMTRCCRLSDLMTIQDPHFVDYFTWIDIVAWTILAMAR